MPASPRRSPGRAARSTPISPFSQVAGTALERAGEAAGLRTIREIYVDRGYTDDGHLAPRGSHGAVLHDVTEAAARAVRMVADGAVTSLGGRRVPVGIESPLRARRHARRGRDGARGARRIGDGWCGRRRLRGVVPGIRLMPAPPRFLPAGESALVVEYGVGAEPAHHEAVLALDAALAESPLEGILETVPTYRSLMIHLDPRVLTHEALAAHVAGLDPASSERPVARRWRVPACYDDPHAEDLAEVAGLLGIAPEEVAALHAGASYRVRHVWLRAGLRLPRRAP